MARKSAKNYNVETMQPDELNELKKLVQEYVRRMTSLEDEIMLLREDKKTLNEEFSEKLDTKTLNQVLRILKIESEVVHKDTYDTFKEALSLPTLDDVQNSK